jgi:hypothetical protein
MQVQWHVYNSQMEMKRREEERETYKTIYNQF